MKKINLLILILICLMTLVSCNEKENAPANDPKTTYTVTWKNADGIILETDIDVIGGSIPTYNGAFPVSVNSDYYFAGWSPSLEYVTTDITYTATYVEIKEENKIPGILPTLSEDGKSVLYGFYPQTRVKETTLISTLNTLQPSEVNGWYLYNGIYYAKEVANVFKNANYTFDDGTSIVSGETYWFKCEPIKWDILKNENGEYMLLSDVLLDAYKYYSSYNNRTIDNKTISPNNYKESDIRKWLNDTFYKTAFALNNSFVSEIFVDNSLSTVDSNNNKYICETTKDKVYLPSYKDYLNTEYGFDSTNDTSTPSRQCKTTDYSRTKGVWYNTGDKNSELKYFGSYWTRTPSSEFYYSAWNVNSTGHLSEYAVDGDSHSVRPCITIVFLFK